ncbi:MAG: hypothetical protein JSR48_04355 [Verrucomicrobia bacterium]|nr:hypothetical protein [Verrucomicrobiota bacterium]
MDITAQAQALLARGVPKPLIDNLVKTAAALPRIIYEDEGPTGSAVRIPAALPRPKPLQVVGGDEGETEEWKKELWKGRNWKASQ